MRNPHFAAAVLLAALLGACSSISKTSDYRALPGTPPWANPPVLHAIAEPREDPAALAPADARFYLHVDNLADAELRGRDPLAAWAWKSLNKLNWPDNLAGAAKKLDLTRDEMLARYFGQTLAIVEQKKLGSYGIVYISRADSSDLRRLPKLLKLTPIEPGEIGPFQIYVTRGKERKRLIMAIGDQWLLVAPEEDHAHIRRTITAVAEHQVLPRHQGEPTPGSAPMLDEPTFRAVLAKTEAKPTSRMFIRNSTDTSRQAMAIVPDGEQMAVHYTASSEKFKTLGPIAAGDSIDFGPLPANAVITAATLNVGLPAASPSTQSAVNALAFPNNFENDIQPRLAAPVIAFLAQMPATSVKPTPDMSVPVFGLALKLKDRGVSERLDDMLRRAHSLFALSELNVIKSLFGGARVVRYGDVRYTVLDFGTALSAKVKDPFFASLMRLPNAAGFSKLCFGRIGDWYVICSQETFFRQCVAAAKDPHKAIAEDPAFAAVPLENKPQLLMSAVLRAPEMTSLLQEARAFWDRFEEAAAKRRAAEQAKMASATAASGTAKPAASTTPKPVVLYRRSKPFDQPLEWIAHAFKDRHSFYVQLWRESDETIRGRLQLIPETRVAQTPANAPTAPVIAGAE